MKSNSNINFLNFLAFSVIIHLLILILNLNNEVNQQAENDKQKQQTNLVDFKTIYPPEEKFNSTVLEPINIDGKGPQANKDCEDGTWYGGIGVKVLTENESMVLSVFDGYPAERAGIMLGDKLTSLNDGQIKGEPGSLAIIQIDRDGLVHTVPIIREKICYGD